MPITVLKQYNNRLRKNKKDSLIIALGGPVQSMLTGLFGVLLLYIRRGKIVQGNFEFIEWLGVFLALFWSRQIFNLLSGFIKYASNKSERIFGGDEANISTFMGLPSGVLGLISGIIGMAICMYVVLYIVPIKDKVKFTISGIIGSILGYFCWFHLLGPILLP